MGRALGLSIPLSVVAGALGGALVTVLAGGRGPSAPATAQVVQPPAAATSDDLAARLDGLEDRLTALESRPAPTAREPVGGTTTERALTALRADLEAVQGLREPGDPAQLEQAVERGLQELEGRRDALEALADGAAGGSLDERVERLAAYLDLDDAQRTRARDLLRARGEHRAELLRRWAEGADPASLDALRETHDRELRSALDAMLRDDQAARLRRLYEGSAPGG